MRIKKYIEDIPMWAKHKNSLKDIREFLVNMEILPGKGKKPHLIHIAGTNGKGSVCAYTSTALIRQGYRVGSFISPHLVEPNERILLNMQAITDAYFEEAGEFVIEKTENLCRKGYQPPTYFEFLFYMAMYVFAKEDLDFIVLETGLGGLYDVTNAIEDKSLCILTSISKDHCLYLGESIDKICSQKAGILREGIPLVYDDQNPEVAACIESFVEKLHIYSVYRSSQHADLLKENMGEAFSSLRAQYQIRNAALAVLSLKALYEAKMIESFSFDRIRESILSVQWRGRMQELYKDVYLDGAHNEDAFLQMADTCLRLCRTENKKLRLLLSAVEDKNIPEMFGHVKKLEKDLSRLYLAKLESRRGAELPFLQDSLQRLMDTDIRVYDSVEEAFARMLRDKKEDELCFAFGSLYMIGEILRIFA